MLIVVELPALLQPNRDLPDRPDRERIVAPTPIIGIAIDCVNDSLVNDRKRIVVMAGFQWVRKMVAMGV
jgi:hypothetical protein